MVACRILGGTDCVLRVGGFGEADWGLDISYDLSTIVEQLPQVRADLKSGVETEFDLYAQGVERTVVLIPDGDFLTSRCLSRTSWVPPIPEERNCLDRVQRMLENLAADFVRSVAIACPGLEFNAVLGA